ncbi:MAG: ammonium transporter [Actinomycetales bacterium]|nr:ammonium transporter [Actinomycetales bacterium]
MMSFIALGTVTPAWVLWGYGESFGTSLDGLGLVGNPVGHIGLSDLLSADAVMGPPGHQIPTLAFAAFQATFAIIAVALVSGAIADRAKFSTWTVFTVLWATIVYFPVAHWVFRLQYADPRGWLDCGATAGRLTFAGGTVLEINCGAAGLALALVVGKRLGFRKDPCVRTASPSSCWALAAVVGVVRSNAGSMLAATRRRRHRLMNTRRRRRRHDGVARGGTVRDGHATSLGAAPGLVAGLVAITPSCSAVTPVGAVAIGGIAGSLCAYAVAWKFRYGYDDSLDVVGVHLVGGLVGTIGIGFFEQARRPPAGIDGLLAREASTNCGVRSSRPSRCFAFVLPALGLALHRTLGFRVDRDDGCAASTSPSTETAYDLVAPGRSAESARGPAPARRAAPRRTCPLQRT